MGGNSARGPLLPGAPVRLAVGRLLPAWFKRAVKRRLLGTRWFPRPPVRTGARPAVPALRRFDLTLPPAPGGAPGRVLSVECPPGLFIPRKLDEHGLGAYEPYALDTFLALVETARPGAVLDVGANVGLYGLLAAAWSDRSVHCFEPTPDLAGTARSLARRNGLDVTVAEIALGAESGTATLYLSDSTDSSNSLNPDFRAHSKELTVPLETLDEYVARTGAVPAVLKVDTETTEPEILAGATKTIREHRPWILVEVLWSLVEDRLHAVMDEFGYTYHHLNGPGPRPAVERIVGDSTWTHYMYLLAPEPLDDAFWERAGAWREVLERATTEHPAPDGSAD